MGPNTTEKCSLSYRADTDQLVRVVHHGDEKVEQDDDVDDREAPEHNETPKPRELFDSCQLKVVQVYQAESRPEQGLRCLPQTEEKENWFEVSKACRLTWQISCRPGNGLFLSLSVHFSHRKPSLVDGLKY